MRSNIATEASIGTRIHQWWLAVPLVTASVFAVCVAVFAADLLVGYDSFREVCFAPALSVVHWQVYRALTSIVFHKGLLHIALNLSTLLPLAAPLERHLGSLRLLHALLLFALLNAAIHSLLAFFPGVLLGWWRWWGGECCIGFSGVLFALIVLDLHVGGGSHRSIFGFFTVSTAWYPWVLLVLFQLLLPSASLLGHLSGVLSGLAYVRGSLSIVTPSSATLNFLESSRFLAPIVRRPGFIAGGHPISAAAFTSLGDLSSLRPASISQSLHATWRSMQASVARMQERWRSVAAAVQQQQEQQRLLQQQQQQQQQQQGSHNQRVYSQGPLSNVHSLSAGAPVGSANPQASFQAQGWGQSAGQGGMQAAATAADPRFPGRGRTLADSAAPGEPPLAGTATVGPFSGPPLQALPLQAQGLAGAAAARESVGVAVIASHDAPNYPLPNAAAASASAAAAAAAMGRATLLSSGWAHSEPQLSQNQQAHLSGHPELPATSTRSASYADSHNATDRAAAVQQLCDMGFTQLSAEEALSATNGDLSLAVELLTEQV
ncbi:hypothetical protein CLOP_g5477 [Closterium sp. NIES-67]|nr:hypothetical protein CLOP_g5477 [Closterium sp. NIES-67]